MPTFPTQTVLDNFNRANENPLSNGGKWVALGRPHIPAGIVGRVNENVYGTFIGSVADARWTPEEIAEPGVSAKLVKATSVNTTFSLWCCVGLSGAKAAKGYRLEVVREATEHKYKVKIIKVEPGEAETLLVEKTVMTIADGDLIGISAVGGKVISWTKSGAGAWTVISEVADASYTTGYIGIGCEEQPEALDDVSAGTGAAVSHSHTLTVTQPQTTTRVTNPSRILKASQTQTPSHTEIFGPAHTHTLPIAQTQVVTRLLKQLQQRFLLTQPQSPKLAKALARTLTTTQPQSAVLTKVDVHVTSGLLSMVI